MCCGTPTTGRSFSIRRTRGCFDRLIRRRTSCCSTPTSRPSTSWSFSGPGASSSRGPSPHSTRTSVYPWERRRRCASSGGRGTSCPFTTCTRDGSIVSRFWPSADCVCTTSAHSGSRASLLLVVGNEVTLLLGKRAPRLQRLADYRYGKCPIQVRGCAKNQKGHDVVLDSIICRR